MSLVTSILYKRIFVKSLIEYLPIFNKAAYQILTNILKLVKLPSKTLDEYSRVEYTTHIAVELQQTTTDQEDKPNG